MITCSAKRWRHWIQRLFIVVISDLTYGQILSFALAGNDRRTTRHHRPTHPKSRSSAIAARSIRVRLRSRRVSARRNYARNLGGRILGDDVTPWVALQRGAPTNDAVANKDGATSGAIPQKAHPARLEQQLPVPCSASPGHCSWATPRLASQSPGATWVYSPAWTIPDANRARHNTAATPRNMLAAYRRISLFVRLLIHMPHPSTSERDSSNYRFQE